MSLILPKGIVVNSPDISDNIGRIDREPLANEEIAGLWKVYTTTKRRLLDPTAERLENFWWRIWGSRRRSLKGATVAMLFTYISDGNSFRPLRGPPNRLEPDPPENRSKSGFQEASSSQPHAVLAASCKEQDDGSTAATAAIAAPAAAEVNPSSPMPPPPTTPTTMPPPILKKNRGPSSTGPRPTARFVSPHSSEEEAVDHGEDSASGVEQAPAPSVVISRASSTSDIPSVKGGRKSGLHPKKKTPGFVAGGHKKRPVIVRRQSSQSSAADGARDSDNSTSSVSIVIPEVPEEHMHHEKPKVQSKFIETLSSSSDMPPPLKSPRKRPVKKHVKAPSKHTEFVESHTSHPKQTKRASKAVGPEDVITSAPQPIGPSREDTPVLEDMDEEVQAQHQLLADYNASLGSKKKSFHGYGTPDLGGDHFGSYVRRSGAEAREHRSPSISSHQEPNLKGSVSLAPSYTAAVGALNLGNPSNDDDFETSTTIKGKQPVRDFGFSQTMVDQSPKITSPLRTSRTDPIQPEFGRSLSKLDPLSRSKSQLSLLLEKDRARVEHKSKQKDEGKSRRFGKLSSDK